MMQRPSHKTSFGARRGFSLLELSVVLGIIALIAGVGMTMAQGALKAADRITTQERLNTIKIALDSFAKTYGYYPCPFDRALVPSGATYGLERRTASVNDCGAAVGTSFVKPSNIVIGGVPVRSLGLPDHYAGDAWGNKFTYAVTGRLAKEPTRVASDAGLIVVKYGTGAGLNYTLMRRTHIYNSVTAGTTFNSVAARPSELTVGDIVHIRSGNTPPRYSGSAIVTAVAANSFTTTDIVFGLDDTGTVEYQDAGDNASYIVISHGADGRGAFPVANTAVPAKKLCVGSAPSSNDSPPPCTDSVTATCIDIENCNTTNATFFDTAFNDGPQPTQYFDDYVVWGSNDVMRAPVNTGLYTANAAPSNCPTNVCEAWCAACTKNFPGGLGVVPPAAITSNPVLCKKVISSNAATCTASCFWSGTTASGYQPCP